MRSLLIRRGEVGWDGVEVIGKGEKGVGKFSVGLGQTKMLKTLC